MTSKPADIQLNPLTPDDLEAVIAIDSASSGTSRRGYFEKRLVAATERPQDYVFVGLSVGGTLVGFAFAGVVSGAFGQSGASASLDAIGVSPDHAMQGYGHKLLAEVEAVLKRKGVTTLASQIDWPQQPVLGFMAHAGFALAPRLILVRSTAEIPPELEEEEEPAELDYSSPVGDPGNALSRDRIPVRSMKAEDLAKIVSIDAANTGTKRRDYYTRKQYETLEQSGVQVSLVAEEDGYPVGFIMARVDFGEFGRAGTEAVMDSIGVDPGFHGKGIGRALMARLMGNLGSLRVETVRTEVAWTDTRLTDYFAGVGFAPAQRIALTKTL